MSCFNNIIGIKGACGTEPTPESGWFIQDLPYISVEKADKVIHSENESGFQLIEDKIQLAVKHVTSELSRYASPKFKRKSLVQSETIGHWRQNLETQAAQVGYWVGVQIKMTDNEFLKFFLSSVSLQFQATGAKNLFFFDLVGGTQIGAPIPVTVTSAGLPETIYPAIEYENLKQERNLLLAYDGSEASFVTDLNSGGSCANCSEWLKRQYVTFRGVKLNQASTIIEDNLENQNGTSGISFDYSILCSMTEWLCGLRPIVSLPILYKAGELIVKEMRVSGRFNSVVALNGNKHADLENYFADEYGKQMSEALNTMTLPQGHCWSCSERARTLERIP